MGSISYSRPDTARGCAHIGASFTPAEGKDYEVMVDIGSQSCQLKVAQVQLKDAAVLLAPVAATQALKCTAQDVQPLAVCKVTLAECKDDVLEKFRATSSEGKPDKAAFAGCAAQYTSCAAATK